MLLPFSAARLWTSRFALLVPSARNDVPVVSIMCDQTCETFSEKPPVKRRCNPDRRAWYQESPSDSNTEMPAKFGYGRRPATGPGPGRGWLMFFCEPLMRLRPDVAQVGDVERQPLHELALQAEGPLLVVRRPEIARDHGDVPRFDSSSSGNALASVMFGIVGLAVTVTPCRSVEPADHPM